MTKRLQYVDIAKGIGILLVTLSHSILPESARWAEGFYIPLFFFLSGFTCQKVDVKKKINSLLVPYVVFNALILALVFVTHSKGITPQDFCGILYSRYALRPLSSENNVLLMRFGNATLWFLTAMFVSNVLFKVILANYDYKVFFVFAYLFLAWILSKFNFLFPWSVDSAFVFSLFMLVGYLSRDVFVSKTNIVLFAFIYLVAAYLNGHVNLSVREYGSSMLLMVLSGLTGSIVVIYVSKLLDRLSVGRAFSFVGRHSLAIFSVQLPILHIVKTVAGRYGVFSSNSMVSSLVICFFQIIACFAVGIIVSILYKRLSALYVK